MPRPTKCRKVCHYPQTTQFLPRSGSDGKAPVILTVDEYETLRLIDREGLSQEECARRIGKSQSAVANKLRLLKLPREVLELLREHHCSERHARALLPLEDGELQRKAAGQVVKLGLTVAQTEALVEKLLSASPKRKKPTFILKDVRLFLNTISRSMELMRSAGVDAKCQREDLEGEICLTIRIPKAVK